MRPVALQRSRPWSCFVCVAVISAGVAGCSSDATRFNDPLGNPFASRNSAPAADVTGSIPPAQAAPVSRIETRPLPSAPQATYNPPASQPAYNPPAPQATYRPPATQPSQQPRYNTASADVTGSISTRPLPRGAAPEAGGAITVQPGDTIHSLSQRYGVSAAALMQANGLSSPQALQAGQRLVIPRAGVAPAAPSRTVAATPAAAPAPAGSGTVHIVNPGETLSAVARKYGKSRDEIARANGVAPDHHVRIGERLTIPGAAPVRTVAAAPAAAQPVVAAKPAAPAPQPAAPAQQAAPAHPVQKVAVAEPTATARLASPATETPAEAKNDAGEVTGSTGFRWPVRGRVIAGFGAKPNGQQNEGINLAVPEGTAIRAAEDGVVAYAGNELKGYGNLILVRHPNGYVTAYAHASELMVKRGDNVRRGQVIARSGQTGNVSSPQLHFEIRKGSTPVDPMQFLSGT